VQDESDLLSKFLTPGYTEPLLGGWEERLDALVEELREQIGYPSLSNDEEEELRWAAAILGRGFEVFVREYFKIDCRKCGDEIIVEYDGSKTPISSHEARIITERRERANNYNRLRERAQSDATKKEELEQEFECEQSGLMMRSSGIAVNIGEQRTGRNKIELELPPKRNEWLNRIDIARLQLEDYVLHFVDFFNKRYALEKKPQYVVYHEFIGVPWVKIFKPALCILRPHIKDDGDPLEKDSGKDIEDGLRRIRNKHNKWKAELQARYEPIAKWRIRLLHQGAYSAQLLLKKHGNGTWEIDYNDYHTVDDRQSEKIRDYIYKLLPIDSIHTEQQIRKELDKCKSKFPAFGHGELENTVAPM
jgi:hypothetical protein